MTVAARRIEAPPLAPLDQVDDVARRLLPALRSMVRAEVEHLKVLAPRVRISKVDAELMEACRKVATAVELRFDVRGSPSLAAPVRRRLERLAGRRLTKDGVIVIRADRFRTQEMNRSEARERLAELIREAATPPKPRIKTKPTKASRERRLKSKEARGEVKRGRQKRVSFD